MIRTLKMCCIAGLVAGCWVAEMASAAPVPKGWVRVVTDESNQTWYVDSGSLQSRGKVRYFWSYVVGNSPYPDESGRLVYGAAFYLSTDCQTKSYRLRFTRLLDENNKTVQEYNHGSTRPMAQAVPGSGEEASMKFACLQRR